jgi:hypothetical protein
VFHVLPEWPVQAGERKKSVFTKEISTNQQKNAGTVPFYV